MKKFAILLFVAMTALSVKAQVYVGGSVTWWHSEDIDATIFALNPEVGYNLNEKWAVGGVLTFAHSKLDEGKYNAFGLAPYARYSYYENKVVRLFVDGGFGFSTQKIKGSDSVNGFELGFKAAMVSTLQAKTFHSVSTTNSNLHTTFICPKGCFVQHPFFIVRISLKYRLVSNYSNIINTRTQIIRIFAHRL